MSSVLPSTVPKRRVCFVQDQEQVDKLLDSRNRLPHIRHVIYIDPTGMRNLSENPWLISFSELIRKEKLLMENSQTVFCLSCKRRSG